MTGARLPIIIKMGVKTPSNLSFIKEIRGSKATKAESSGVPELEKRGESEVFFIFIHG